jgi:hypothetical protein
MSLTPAWPQCLAFFDTPLVIKPSPGRLVASAPPTITGDDKVRVYGAPNPPLTASYAGLVNGDTPASLTKPVSISTAAMPSSPTGAYSIIAGGTTDPNYTITFMPGMLTILQDATTTTAFTSASTANFGQTVTLTATVIANAPGSGTPTGIVDLYDPITATDLGTASLSNGVASLSTATLPVGNHTITFSYSGDGNFLASSTTATVTITTAVYLLDSTAGSALSLSGNANVNIAGPVQIDSNSSNALSASGIASLTATSIRVVGGVSHSGRKNAVSAFYIQYSVFDIQYFFGRATRLTPPRAFALLAGCALNGLGRLADGLGDPGHGARDIGAGDRDRGGGGLGGRAGRCRGNDGIGPDAALVAEGP